jgi:small subunit ribosomal protein S5
LRKNSQVAYLFHLAGGIALHLRYWYLREVWKRKNLFRFPLKNSTVPHAVTGHFGAGTVIIRPASSGTGIIAGGAVRAMMEVAGVQNVLCKSLGSGNPFNVTRATVEGLRLLRSPEDVLREREGKAEEGAG